MYQVLFHLKLALQYLSGDKSLTEQQKNDIAVRISKLISYLNETYYSGKFKI